MTSQLPADTIALVVENIEREAAQDKIPCKLSELREETEVLDFLFTKGLFQGITSRNFPSLPQEKVALAHFFALDNTIDGLITARTITQNEHLKHKLGVLITFLIKERDFDFNSTLQIKGEVDEKLISAHASFKMAGESIRLLEMVLGLGLTDQLTEGNFPAIKALSERERTFLQLKALESKLSKLEEIKSRFKELGYTGNGKEGTGMKERLDTEIKTVEKHYLQCLDTYLNS